MEESGVPGHEDLPFMEEVFPFVYDVGPVFIFATCEGGIGLLASNWERLNERLLEDVVRVIGAQPNCVIRGGSDFGPLDSDEDDRHEWPYLEAVWENVPLDKINWLRWQLFCPPE